MPMEKTFDAAAAEPRIYAAWEQAGAFRAGANASRARDLLRDDPAAERHRRAACRPCLQQHAAGHPHPLAPDARLRHALAARPGPCRHRHPAAGRAQADGEIATAAAPTCSARNSSAMVWEWKRQSGDTIINQLKRLGASCDWSAQRLHHVRRPRRARGRGGQFPRRGAQGLCRSLQQGPDLPRQAAGELGPAFRDRDLRPRGREHRGRGPYVALQIPARRRRDL